MVLSLAGQYSLTAFGRNPHELFHLLLREYLFLRPPYLDGLDSSTLHSTCVRFVVVDMSTPSSTSRSTPLPQLTNIPPSLSIREQAEALDMSTFTPCNSIDDIPRLIIKGRPFILESLLRNKHSKDRYSWVWQHGTGVLDLSSERPNRKAYWVCNRCDEKHKIVLFSAETTSNASDHLYVAHRVNKPGSVIVDNASSRSTETLDNMFSRASKRQRTSSIEVPTNLWDRFKAALIA